MVCDYLLYIVLCTDPRKDPTVATDQNFGGKRLYAKQLNSYRHRRRGVTMCPYRPARSNDLLCSNRRFLCKTRIRGILVADRLGVHAKDIKALRLILCTQRLKLRYVR